MRMFINGLKFSKVTESMIDDLSEVNAKISTYFVGDVFTIDVIIDCSFMSVQYENDERENIRIEFVNNKRHVWYLDRKDIVSVSFLQ